MKEGKIIKLLKAFREDENSVRVIYLHKSRNFQFIVEWTNMSHDGSITEQYYLREDFCLAAEPFRLEIIDAIQEGETGEVDDIYLEIRDIYDANDAAEETAEIKVEKSIYDIDKKIEKIVSHYLISKQAFLLGLKFNHVFKWCTDRFIADTETIHHEFCNAKVMGINEKSEWRRYSIPAYTVEDIPLPSTFRIGDDFYRVVSSYWEINIFCGEKKIAWFSCDPEDESFSNYASMRLAAVIYLISEFPEVREIYKSRGVLES